MSRAFSSNLVSSRHEKGVSQKEAAEALGITPALLSHYETGIRECKLDMIARLSEYYGVTADYLLGCSSSRHGAGEMFNMDCQNGDEETSIRTIIRSIIDLSQLSDSQETGNEKFFCDYFSLCIKKYMDAVTGRTDGRARFTTQVLDGLSPDNIITAEETGSLPVCTQTVVSNADYVTDKALAGMLGRK